MEHLKQNLIQILNMPTSAVEYLLMVYQAAQTFDDVADGDAVERKELDTTIWNVFVGIHQNQFFLQNSHLLVPIMATAVLKWQASDNAERQGTADARSYMWRAGYYDLVLMAVTIVHGAEFATKNANVVMSLYGESLDGYLKEFNNA